MNIQRKRQAVSRSRVQPLRPSGTEPVKSPEPALQGPPVFLIQVLGYVQAGELGAAIDLLKQNIDTDPFTVYSNLGSIYLSQNRLEEAEETLQKALGLNPEAVGSAINLAQVYRDTQRPGKAITCLQQAATQNPEHIDLYHHLGNAYIQAGLADQGLNILRYALEKASDNRNLRSDYLFQYHYIAAATPETLFGAYKQWGRLFAPVSPGNVSYQNKRATDRVLRIGYISPNFCQHALSYFIEPLLESHDRDKVEIYGYGHVTNPDDVTERLKGKCDHYLDIVNQDDQAVADQITQDQIDILVDLAGHTAGNRLGVLALKPAPVAVTYMGHFDTTGVPQIDYRMTEAKAESERSRQCTTETLVDLPKGLLCYRPPEFAPDVTEAPFLKNGYITFGSFNEQARINKNMIALWSQILSSVSNSRFLLKLHVAADDDTVKNAYLECFEHYGVTADRLDIQLCGESEDRLVCLDSVDVALDTFPCNGTTITCDTLWMGVPVVTLKGDLHCSRMGHSLLSQLDMAFLAVDTPEDYVTMACALAQKPEAISQMRDTMRLRMKSSALCQADDFVGHLESAYQTMWENWCKD